MKECEVNKREKSFFYFFLSLSFFLLLLFFLSLSLFRLRRGFYDVCRYQLGEELWILTIVSVVHMLLIKGIVVYTFVLLLMLPNVNIGPTSLLFVLYLTTAKEFGIVLTLHYCVIRRKRNNMPPFYDIQKPHCSKCAHVRTIRNNTHLICVFNPPVPVELESCLEPRYPFVTNLDIPCSQFKVRT